MIKGPKCIDGALVLQLKAVVFVIDRVILGTRFAIGIRFANVCVFIVDH